jgi:hypothetical protein
MDRCVISIDVGVKNLAICMLAQGRDCNQDTVETKILHWQWYNVLSIDETNSATPQLARKTKMRPSLQYGVCRNIIKRTKKPCGNKGVINCRGRAYCGRHDPSKKHTAVDTQQWCYAMLSSLPRITDDLRRAFTSHTSVDIEDMCPYIEVVIEQQSVDNKRILMQSHLLFGHFVQLFDNKVGVKFIPAYNKLLVYDGPEIVTNLKTPYARRKFLAKRHTEHFLVTRRTLQDWQTYFYSCKSKQDDIADAFLQGLYVLEGGAQHGHSRNDAKTRKKRRKIRF